MSLKDLNVAIHTVFCKNTRRATCNKLATETGNSASMYSQRGAISIGQSMLVFSVWKQTAVTYWCPPGIVFTSLLNHPSMTIWNCVEWHNSVQKRSSCSVLFRPRDRRGLEMRSSSGWWQAGLKREKGQLWHSRTRTCSSKCRWDCDGLITTPPCSPCHLLFPPWSWKLHFCQHDIIAAVVEDTKEAAADTHVFSTSKRAFQI